MRTLEFRIEPEHDGMAASDYLRRIHSFSYSLIVKLRHNSMSMLLDGVPIRTIDPVKANSLLVVSVPEKGCTEEPNYDLKVRTVYEDDDLIVIDKPPHMPVHPAKGHQLDTLANYCAAHYPDMKFRVIGRLDKDTSGLVIVAKNIHSAAVLTDSSIEKQYIAIAEGNPSQNHYEIDGPIDDSNPETCRRYVSENGKPAFTVFDVLCRGNGLFAAKVMPKTGRTHQIRVHFSYMGFPICGDRLYDSGIDLIDRHALHRSGLSFMHPVTGKALSFSSEIPEDMKKLFDFIQEAEKNG